MMEKWYGWPCLNLHQIGGRYFLIYDLPLMCLFIKSCLCPWYKSCDSQIEHHRLVLGSTMTSVIINMLDAANFWYFEDTKILCFVMIHNNQTFSNMQTLSFFNAGIDKSCIKTSRRREGTVTFLADTWEKNQSLCCGFILFNLLGL